MDHLRRNNEVLLPVDFYGRSSSHATLLYIKKKSSEDNNYEMYYIETEKHGHREESLTKEAVIKKQRDAETGIREYGALFDAGDLENDAFDSVGEYEYTRRRIFSVRTSEHQFMQSESIDLLRSDTFKLRNVLGAGVVVQHSSYGDAGNALAAALTAMAGEGVEWKIHDQRPIKVQRGTNCELISIQSFCAMLFHHEESYLIAKYFMTKHANDLISKEDVRAALNCAVEFGLALDPPEVYFDADQLDERLDSRQVKTTTKIAETLQLAASRESQRTK